MNSKEVLADFRFLGNRVKKLVLDTKLIENKNRAEIFFDFDYQTSNIEESEGKLFGVLLFKIQIKAKVKNKILFKIDLEMDGAFAGNVEKLNRKKFVEMLEMNGLITLLHISRAYLLSVTAQSGIQPPVQIPMVNILKLRDQKAKLTGNNKNSDI